MAERGELLEAALEVYPEGLALLDTEGRVVFWNHEAEAITGFARASLVSRELPQALGPVVECRDYEAAQEPRNAPQLGRGLLVHAQHARGHDVPVISRKMILRDGTGERIGSAAVFHPAERIAALPHGETSKGSEVQASLNELQARLEAEFEAFVNEHAPLGVLWVTVDQADEMKKTHGARACETMLEAVERTLANALRPGEEIGRWGDDEFLVLSHEEHAEVLANHAKLLLGVARTTDFQWWGDRISLTVSVGAAEAGCAETLPELLSRAQFAMETSAREGGNRVTLAERRQA